MIKYLLDLKVIGGSNEREPTEDIHGFLNIIWNYDSINLRLVILK